MQKLLIQILAIIFIITIVVCSNAQTTISGIVSGSWTITDSPYIVIGDITVEQGDTLIIEQGVNVLFNGRFSFKIEGLLKAIGTEVDSIIFSHNHPDSLWAGIEIYGDNNKSVLEYCHIEYSNVSGIDISGSSPTIKHCHILNNSGGGIDVFMADPLIVYNVIEYNSAQRGGGIHIYDNPVSRPGLCRIYNNVIRHNTAIWGGGIRVFSDQGCTPIICNNVFDGNSVTDSIYGGNLYVFPGAKPQIINNIIINSPNGSGILDLSNSIIRYNDVWNNHPYNYVNTSPGIGDISTDPLFVGGTPFDYHLLSNSPCIDTGDPEQPLDPDNTIADMGAFYFGIDQPPLPVSDLIAIPGDQRITFSWTNPNIIDYEQTRLVRNISAFPQNPDDGVTVFEGRLTLFQDIGLTNGQTYYYGLFVYDLVGYVSSPVHISAIPAPSQPSVIRVPWDYTTIQEALIAASPGDTVLVYPGTYSPSTNSEIFPIILADSVTLLSKASRDSTTIDAEQTNLVILAANNARISGFTITGGFNTSITVDPGGFYGDPSGGGILCNSINNMIISNNKIIYNEANGEYLWDGRGGGIFIWESYVDIINNIIQNNLAGREGGGIYCNGSAGFHPETVNIEKNLITTNHRCGVIVDGVKAFIKNNIVANNTTGGTGWDLPSGLEIRGNAYVYNNVITNNRNIQLPGSNSGVFSHGGGTLINNIIGGNSRFGGVEIGFPSWGVTGFSVTYCLVWGGYPGLGNINTYPEFVGGTPFDYHLTENSPCIDAGDPNFSLDPDGTRSDIGAFYYHHTDHADIDVDDYQIDLFLKKGVDSTQTITLSNNGNWPLHYKIGNERITTNRKSTGGPDEFGYSFIDSDTISGPIYDWLDVSDIGTLLPTNTNQFNEGPFDLGFDYNFYDQNFDSIRISSHGFLSFTHPYPERHNHQIPSTVGVPNLIAAFWDDYQSGITKGVFYYNDIQNERFIVQYDSLKHAFSSSFETFQIIINKNGSIILQYKDVMLGNSGTVGIQNSNGQFGLGIAYDENYLHSNMAIKIYQGDEWLEFPTTTGQISPGENKTVTFKITAANILRGNYQSNIVIYSNDPDEPTLIVPFNLTVLPDGNSPPVINNLPDSVVFIADSSTSLNLWDYVNDYETHDSLLSYDFTTSNDSISYVYNQSTGELILSSIHEFSGYEILYITVSDDSNATAEDSLKVIITPVTDLDDPIAEIPEQFLLSQNYPNPFNPETTIKYQLPKLCDVKLKIFNMLGQQVIKLVDTKQPAGYYSIKWDSRDNFGGNVASGVYFYRLEAGDFVKTKKLVLLQ